MAAGPLGRAFRWLRASRPHRRPSPRTIRIPAHMPSSHLRRKPPAPPRLSDCGAYTTWLSLPDWSAMVLPPLRGDRFTEIVDHALGRLAVLVVHDDDTPWRHSEFLRADSNRVVWQLLTPVRHHDDSQLFDGSSQLAFQSYVPSLHSPSTEHRLCSHCGTIPFDGRALLHISCGFAIMYGVMQGNRCCLSMRLV